MSLLFIILLFMILLLDSYLTLPVSFYKAMSLIVVNGHFWVELVDKIT